MNKEGDKKILKNLELIKKQKTQKDNEIKKKRKKKKRKKFFF